jgi:iron(III) transport system substrate-binding protein
MSARRRLIAVFVLLGALAGPVACGGDDGPKGGPGTLTIYSGRQEQLVGDLIERFERQSGIDVEVRYGDSAELAATIAEEGGNSPADVFFSQDAGALGAVAGENLLAPLAASQIATVPERFRDPRNRWTGVSGRARVIAYNTKAVPESEVPDTVFAVTGPRWKGRVGIAPTNASFQSFVSAMRISAGDARTKAFLEGLEENDVQRYENNIAIMEALARGEIDLGLVNHYYLAEVKKEQPGASVANHFLRPRDPGTLVNVAGIGILRRADSPRAAQRFTDFLLTPAGQRYFVEETDEYPLVPGVAPPPDAPPLGDVQGPEIALGQLGTKLESTLVMLDEVGLTR